MYLDVYQVCDRLGCAQSKAYTIIKQLNDELKAKGYITISGKISRKYFNERCYGTETEDIKE